MVVRGFQRSPEGQQQFATQSLRLHVRSFACLLTQGLSLWRDQEGRHGSGPGAQADSMNPPIYPPLFSVGA